MGEESGEIGYFIPTIFHGYIKSEKRIDELSKEFNYEHGVIVEVKHIGRRASLHKKGREVQLQNYMGEPIPLKKDENFLRIKNSALEKKDDFILLGTISDNGKNYYKFNVEDILMLNDEDVTGKKLFFRLNLIKSLEFTDGIIQNQSYLVKDSIDLVEASMVLSKLETSHGINIRYPNSKYGEIECGYTYSPLAKVTGVVTELLDNNKYSVGFSKDQTTLLCFEEIIDTKVKLTKGDIIQLNVDDIKISEDGSKLVLVRPIFCGKVGDYGLTSTQELSSLASGGIN
jgi:hypothetical protein